MKIVVDSTCDMPAEQQAAFDITVVPLQVQLGDESFLDGVTISGTQVYEWLQQGTETATTSQPSVGAFVEAYERLAAETDTILSLHLSGKMSGTVRAAQQAAAMVPQARIEVVDTGEMSMVISFIALAAARAAREGAGLDGLCELVQDIRSRAFTFIGFETLRYLERGGRIGHARAFLGTLMNVKPILKMDHGELHPLERVRSSKRMFTRLVDLAHEQGALEAAALLCSTNCDTAQTMIERLGNQGHIAPEQVMVVQAGGVVGAHVGPGALGIAGVRKRM